MMSSEFEGLPIALLEAMSMNCAVVSTKAGGVVEVIRDNIDGILCDVGNVEGLTNGALRLIQNTEERQQFSKGRSIKSNYEFSLENMVQKLEDVYANELNNGH